MLFYLRRSGGSQHPQHHVHLPSPTHPFTRFSSPFMSNMDHNLTVASPGRVNHVDLSDPCPSSPQATPSDADNTEENNYTGVNWDAIPHLCKTQATARSKKSWVWQYGYRMERCDNGRLVWLCRYCHQHKQTNTHEYIIGATSAVHQHLQRKLPHNQSSLPGFLRSQGICNRW